MGHSRIGGVKKSGSHNQSPVPVGPAVAPAIVSRLPIFDPTFRRACTARIEAETPWGKVARTGRLTETHRKILDALFAVALDRYRFPTGAMALLVDPYRAAKTARVDPNTQWLRRMILEMRVVEIDIQSPSGRYTGGIIAEMHESPRRVPLPGGAFAGRERPLWVVTITETWMRIYDAEVAVRYANVLPELNSLHSGAVHALALHVLSHSGAGSFDVDSVLRHVGAWRDNMSDRAKRELRQKVIVEAARLELLGISLYRAADGRLMASYHPRPDVQVMVPPKRQAEAISPAAEAISPAAEAISSEP